MLMYAQDTFHTELTTLMHDQSATGYHSSGGQESGTLENRLHDDALLCGRCCTLREQSPKPLKMDRISLLYCSGFLGNILKQL